MAAFRNVRFQGYHINTADAVGRGAAGGHGQMVRAASASASAVVPSLLPAAAVGSNTRDPATANCRVFIGNLNTHRFTSADVQEIFQRYGEIVAVSIHKGFAFVQFTNALHARTAAQSEDGKLYAGQVVDCNVASEGKTHATAKKRPKTTPPLRVSYVTKRTKLGDGAGLSAGNPAEVAAKSRHVYDAALPQSVAGRPGVSSNIGAGPSGDVSSMSPAGVMSEKDLLICGRCRSIFCSLEKLQHHKEQQCKLRFVCQCQPVDTGVSYSALDVPRVLTCAGCLTKFVDMWTLIKHVQEEHALPVCLEAGGMDIDVLELQRNELDNIDGDFEDGGILPDATFRQSM